MIIGAILFFIGAYVGYLKGGLIISFIGGLIFLTGVVIGLKRIIWKAHYD